MKVDLVQKPQAAMKDRGDDRTIQWKRSLPFLVNPRGHLVHRVRFVHTHTRGGRWSHDTALYWCGNMGRGEFTGDPPQNRLLCVYCEARAIAAGEKRADELAGRHVCLGTMKTVMQCCRNEQN